MEKPHYTKSPIGYVESLARAISIDKDELVRLAEQADLFYYLHERKAKPNGSYREIYGVKDRLKSVQQKIVRSIYNNVSFPKYLQGSIKDKVTPRSHISNAQLHVNVRVLVHMDISNFYPSVHKEIIFDIWMRFFNFPADVAQILTKLTTYQGFLPQGAPTSSGLGNLVFWEREHEVLSELQELGFAYSRYVDDISVSTDKFIDMSKLATVFSLVFGMFRSRGVDSNRNKIDISTSGYAMTVHNLNVNGKVLTIPKDERGRIRAAVKECENKAKESRFIEEYEALWSSTYGRVMYMKQLHSSKAQSYLVRLEIIRPILSETRLAEVEAAVSDCEKLAATDPKKGLRRKCNKVLEQVAQLSQLYPEQMRQYLDRLRVISPAKLDKDQS
jgi:hypothetical protein